MATLEELTVKIGVDAQDLDQELEGVGETAERSEGRFNKAARGIGVAAVGVGAAIGGIGAYALKAANDQAELADEIQTAASRAGVSTDAYQQFSSVLGDVGMSTSDTNRLLERNNQRMAQAIEGNEKYADAWAALDVELQDANGSMRDQEDVLEDTLIALQDMEDPAEQMAILTDLYGTQMARKLMPALDGTNGSIEEALELYDDHAHLTEDQIEAAVEFGDTMDDFKDALQGVAIELGNFLIPLLQDHLLPAIQDHLIPAVENFIDWLRDARDTFNDLPEPIQNIVTEVGKWAAVVAGLLVVLGPILKVIPGLVAAFKMFLGPLKLLAGLFKAAAAAKALFSAALWASPITWIVVGILLLIAVIILIIVYWDDIAAATAAAWDWIVEKLGEAWDWIKELFTDAWEWLVELVTGLWESISEGFQSGVDWVVGLITGMWESIVEFFTNAWDWLVDLVTGIWESIVEFFQSGVDGAVELVDTGVQNVLDFFSKVGEVPGMIGDFFSDMVSTAAGYISDFLSDVGDIPGNVLDYIGDLGSLLFNAGKDIIQGLIDGVQNMVSSLSDTFSGITDMIPEWKGPHSVDIKLLEGPGEDIMEGLVSGIDNGTVDVRSKLGEVTRSIPGSFDVGSSANVTRVDQTKVVIDFKNLGRSKLAEAIREATRVDGGGDVQTAFGRSGR